MGLSSETGQNTLFIEETDLKETHFLKYVTSVK
jgi:hypothetical protein